MRGKGSFSRISDGTFGQDRRYLWRHHVFSALIAAAAAYGVSASPALSTMQQETAYEGGAINPLTLQKKLRTAIDLMIDPIAAEPEAENLQLQFADHQRDHLSGPALKSEARIIGNATMYNPLKPGDRSGGMATASGEPYEANGWAAAIQIDLRAAFSGVRFGRNYRPAFALVTAGEKSVVVKINDVGPLLPGRVIDFTERTMRYFDASLDRGVLAEVKVTPLAGERWRAGPVEDGPALTMAGDLLDTLH